MAEWLHEEVEDSNLGITVQVECCSASDEIHISMVVNEDSMKGGVLVLNSASIYGLVLLVQNVEYAAELLKKCADTLTVIIPGAVLSEHTIERALGGMEGPTLSWGLTAHEKHRLPIILEQLEVMGLIESHFSAEGERGWGRVPFGKDK